MDRCQTRTDNQIVMHHRDSRGMELIRDRVARTEMETEARADSQVRADRVKTTPTTASQEQISPAQITVSPTLDDFGNTDTTINKNINTANIGQHHGVSKTLPETAELHRYIVIPAYQPDER